VPLIYGEPMFVHLAKPLARFSCGESFIVRQTFNCLLLEADSRIEISCFGIGGGKCVDALRP
jgi:hypothetical protein